MRTTSARCISRSINETTQAAREDAALNPRFYTTDFEELDRLNVDSMREQWEAEKRLVERLGLGRAGS